MVENNDPIDDKDDILTIILVTNLRDINFYSLTGNDAQTQTINQINNVNVGTTQINVCYINWENRVAMINTEGFSAKTSPSSKF